MSRGNRGGRTKARTSGGSSTKRSRRDDGGRRSHRAASPAPLPRVPYNFLCHICAKSHWTVECSRLLEHPEDYPLMDTKRGCWRCGQRGHNAQQCAVKRYHCKECGGMHDTKDCAYDHVSEEWHEFFDPLSKHVFYANSTDMKEVQWVPPTHELDVVLWYCAACQVLVPSKYMECPQCRAIRPVSAEVTEKEKESSESSSSTSSDDEGDAGENGTGSRLSSISRSENSLKT